jgi:glycosyltransferase involved in cell wall biosynthesis
VRAELATPADAVVILQASRFEAWKGHREHLAALASLRHDPRWFCWLAGGGDTAKYEAELRDMAAQLGIVSRIRFCGFRRDVRRLMAAADIYCQPNTAPEPFGLAFAEALSAGLPVVTTAMGGVVELVDSSCGVLLPGSDPAALASALRRLIDDAALRSVLGRNGRARVLRLCNVDDQMARIDGIVGRLGRDYRAAGS